MTEKKSPTPILVFLLLAALAYIIFQAAASVQVGQKWRRDRALLGSVSGQHNFAFQELQRLLSETNAVPTNRIQEVVEQQLEFHDRMMRELED